MLHSAYRKKWVRQWIAAAEKQDLVKADFLFSIVLLRVLFLETETQSGRLLDKPYCQSRSQAVKSQRAQVLGTASRLACWQAILIRFVLHPMRLALYSPFFDVDFVCKVYYKNEKTSDSLSKVFSLYVLDIHRVKKLRQMRFMRV